MARKRVEEEPMNTYTETIDTPIEAPVEKYSDYQVQAEPQRPVGPISCLRNERVEIKFVDSPNALVRSKGHVLSGGMAEGATIDFVVPRLTSTGAFKDVLTTNEKNFLEQALGLEYNALSVYRRQDNFWSDKNPQGIGKVSLHKQGNYLDLSNPIDYIKYKILLANKNYIAASLQELEENPKATYKFVIVSENAETERNLSKMDATKRCYMEYGKIEYDKDTLRVIIETLEGRPTGEHIKIDFLQGKVNDYIQKDPRRFLRVIQDELLPIKVLIKKALEKGIIGKKNDTYYLREDGRPLCEMGEESTLDNAAKYIGSIKRQELKYSLEAKVKD